VDEVTDIYSKCPH